MTSSNVLITVSIALITAIIALFLKETRSNSLALLVTCTGGIVVLLRLIPNLETVISNYSSLGETSGINSYYFGLILKIIGIAYICEFGAQLCRDAAQGALAFKIELAAKIAILILALPVLGSIVQTVSGLL